LIGLGSEFNSTAQEDAAAFLTHMLGVLDSDPCVLGQTWFSQITAPEVSTTPPREDTCQIAFCPISEFGKHHEVTTK